MPIYRITESARTLLPAPRINYSLRHNNGWKMSGHANAGAAPILLNDDMPAPLDEASLRMPSAPGVVRAVTPRYMSDAAE